MTKRKRERESRRESARCIVGENLGVMVVGEQKDAVRIHKQFCTPAQDALPWQWAVGGGGWGG